MTHYKCILIDDEPAAIQRLQNLLKDYAEAIEVAGVANSGEEAVLLIKDLNPDLIFLDIQMPEMSGFEMLQKLDKIPLVVFCTAYDQYALQAFETNSIDYLLKPVKQERLAQTIEKLKILKGDQQAQKMLSLFKELSQENKKKERTSITVKSNNRILFYKLEEIACFKADDKYVTLYHKNGDEKLTEKSLVQLEAELPDYFMRIHRSVIINKNLVQEVQPYFNSRYTVVLNDNKIKVISGRSYLKQIKEWLDT